MAALTRRGTIDSGTLLALRSKSFRIGLQESALPAAGPDYSLCLRCQLCFEKELFVGEGGDAVQS